MLQQELSANGICTNRLSCSLTFHFSTGVSGSINRRSQGSFRWQLQRKLIRSMLWAWLKKNGDCLKWWILFAPRCASFQQRVRTLSDGSVTKRVYLSCQDFYREWLPQVCCHGPVGEHIPGRIGSKAHSGRLGAGRIIHVDRSEIGGNPFPNITGIEKKQIRGGELQQRPKSTCTLVVSQLASPQNNVLFVSMWVMKL